MTLVATSAKSSGSSGDVTQLFASTLGANAASIDTGANGIAQTANVLDIYIVARTTQAAILSSALVRFNGDTGANYDWESVAASNVSASAARVTAQTSINQAAVPGASATAAQPGLFVITIPLYAATVFNKQATILNTMFDPASAANCFSIAALASWRSTAAINQVSVTAGSGNLLAGSAMFIYGRT